MDCWTGRNSAGTDRKSNRTIVRIDISAPRFRAAALADRPALVALLAGLSEESAYSRFLTALSTPPGNRVVDALLPQPPAGRAVLAFVGSDLVGHGLWVRTHASVAEIALVVADAHQQRGIGTALAAAVTDDLARHGVTDVEVFSISDNRAVARMVRAAAPDARRELDGPTTTYTFPARVRAVPRTA